MRHNQRKKIPGAKSRQSALFCALALLLALSLTACGGNDAGGQTSQGGSGGNDPQIPAPAANSEYVFIYHGCPLPMNAEFAPLLDYIGEPDSYFEAASCAFDGLDKTYTYSDMELITYPDEDKDYISSIRILSDAVSTPEGITIGSAPEEVEAAYGSEYEDFGTQFTYENGDARLSVLFEDGKAVSVEYTAINDLLG